MQQSTATSESSRPMIGSNDSSAISWSASIEPLYHSSRLRRSVVAGPASWQFFVGTTEYQYLNHFSKTTPIGDAGAMAAERMNFFAGSNERTTGLCARGCMVAGRARDMLLHIGKLRQLPKCWSIHSRFTSGCLPIGASSYRSA